MLGYRAARQKTKRQEEDTQATHLSQHPTDSQSVQGEEVSVFQVRGQSLKE
jgi:hypothetical protein